MDTVPDVIGYKLEEALEIIKASGAGVSSVSLTAPPRAQKTETGMDQRVVRIKETGRNVYELIVC